MLCTHACVCDVHIYLDDTQPILPSLNDEMDLDDDSDAVIPYISQDEPVVPSQSFNSTFVPSNITESVISPLKWNVKRISRHLGGQ